jgi:hypothetical protein
MVVPLDCVGFVEKVYFAYHALTLFELDSLSGHAVCV